MIHRARESKKIVSLSVSFFWSNASATFLITSVGITIESTCPARHSDMNHREFHFPSCICHVDSTTLENPFPTLWLSFCCFCVWFSKKAIPDDNMFYVLHLQPHHPQLKNVNLKAEATLAKGCLATSKAGRGDAACSSHCRRPARSHTCRGLKELPPLSIDCFIMYRMLCSPPSVWKTIQKLASSWEEVGKGERHGKLKRRPPW